MKRCVVVGGAEIKDLTLAASFIEENDFVIYCDCGLKHREGLKAEPDMVVGDFDSSENPCLPVETIVLPVVKDDTDTIFAMKEGLRRGFTSFLLLGVFGNRMDHTMANVYSLLYLYNRGCQAIAVDDYSEFEIVGEAPAFVDDRYPFFSLVNIAGLAKGITIKNAKYELEGGEILPEYQYGVSNEPFPGKKTEISVKEGCLLLIKDR